MKSFTVTSVRKDVDEIAGRLTIDFYGYDSSNKGTEYQIRFLLPSVTTNILCLTNIAASLMEFNVSFAEGIHADSFTGEFAAFYTLLVNNYSSMDTGDGFDQFKGDFEFSNKNILLDCSFETEYFGIGKVLRHEMENSIIRRIGNLKTGEYSYTDLPHAAPMDISVAFYGDPDRAAEVFWKHFVAMRCIEMPKPADDLCERIFA